MLRVDIRKFEDKFLNMKIVLLGDDVKRFISADFESRMLGEKGFVLEKCTDFYNGLSYNRGWMYSAFVMFHNPGKVNVHPKLLEYYSNKFDINSMGKEDNTHIVGEKSLWKKVVKETRIVAQFVKKIKNVYTLITIEVHLINPFFTLTFYIPKFMRTLYVRIEFEEQEKWC
jgi:hypothetical protein